MTKIFWQNNTEKPKLKGKVGGSLWDQFIVNAKQGYGKAYFIDCNTAEEGRKIIAQNLHKPAKHKNVFFYGEQAEKATQ